MSPKHDLREPVDSAFEYRYNERNRKQSKPYSRMSVARELYLEERRQHVLKRVREAGRISVAQLSEEFGVSEVTIRLDLQALASSNLIVRTHGGAVATDIGSYEMALSMRR